MKECNIYHRRNLFWHFIHNKCLFQRPQLIILLAKNNCTNWRRSPDCLFSQTMRFAPHQTKNKSSYTVHHKNRLRPCVRKCYFSWKGNGGQKYVCLCRLSRLTNSTISISYSFTIISFYFVHLLSVLVVKYNPKIMHAQELLFASASRQLNSAAPCTIILPAARTFLRLEVDTEELL